MNTDGFVLQFIPSAPQNFPNRVNTPIQYNHDPSLTDLLLLQFADDLVSKLLQDPGTNLLVVCGKGLSEHVRCFCY